MKEQEPDSAVQGEGYGRTLRQPPSIHSRVSNILAISLMSVLGLGMLTWYYANAMTRQSRARQSVQAASAKRAQGEMPLPSLGRIDPPASAERPAAPPDPPAQSAPLAVGALHEIPLEPAQPTAGYGAQPAKTPAQLALERQLSGTVFSPQ